MKKAFFLSIGLIVAILSLSAQDKPWVDFNQNGTQDVFENPDADLDKRITDLLSQMTVKEQITLLSELSPGIPRLNIDKYYHGNEALHGIVRPGHFTVFPQAIGLAATWNPALIRQVASAASTESRARWNELDRGKNQKNNYSDLLTFWSPTVNMARDPRWGRTPETYGEDPFLSGQIGVAFVKGLQGDDERYLKAVSTPKHFVANNEEHNRFSCKVETPETTLRNYFLPAFQALITKGKAHSIMTAYPAVNGFPSACNKWLLTDVLRKEWGFEGYVVSDCSGVSNILWQGYAKTMQEAVAAAMKAGLDLDCGGEFVSQAWATLQQGLIDEQDIANAAYHVLRARFKLGLFDDPSLVPFNSIKPSEVGKKEHQDLALETSRQSIVLLKNNGLLPLNPRKVKSIAVMGINAAASEFGDYSGVPVNTPVSPLEGIQKRAGKGIKVTTLPWIGNLSEHERIRPEFFAHKTSDGSLKPGLDVTFFSDDNFKTKFAETTAAQIELDPVNQPPNPNVPVSKYLSARWTGVIKSKVTGEYEFGAIKTGKVKVFINDEKKLDNSNQDRGTYSFTMRMEAGKTYDLKVEYANWNGDYFAEVQGKAPITYMSMLWKVPAQKSSGLFAAEKALAKKADVAILVMGINKSIEMEGRDRKNMDLPEDQQQFIREIYKVNPKTILVLVAGSQLAVNWEQANLPAIVNAWYPGEQGGTAIAEVLFGDYNPGGRLPLTYYTSLDDIPAFDDYKVTNGRTYMYFKGKPIYPFGYGLTYTTFTYSNVRVARPEVTLGEPVEMSVDVTNTGAREGDEVVQLYLKSPDSRPENPIRQLRGFQRIHLKAGEKQTVTFVLDREALSYWNDKSLFVVEPGKYEAEIGASSADIRQTATFTVKKEELKK